MKLYLLFIGESLGWQELILIGVVALIVLGPRRLPEVARKIGKTMADFRKITNDFKSTWEKEVNFDEEKASFNSIISENNLVGNENTISQPKETEKLVSPQIKQLNEAEIAEIFKKKELNGKVNSVKESNFEAEEQIETQKESLPTSKRDWL